MDVEIYELSVVSAHESMIAALISKVKPVLRGSARYGTISP